MPLPSGRPTYPNPTVPNPLSDVNMVLRLACILHATHLSVAVSVRLSGNVEEAVLQMYLLCISTDHHVTLLVRQVYDSTSGAE